MISACGLLCLAQYARLAAIVGRLHQFHRERFDVFVKASNGEGSEKQVLTNRFEGIGEQADHILERVYMTRQILMCLIFCVLFMIASSLAIGMSLMVGWFQCFTVGFFILGVLSMSAAMAIALVELRYSLREVEYEHDRNIKLDPPVGMPPPAPMEPYP